MNSIRHIANFMAFVMIAAVIADFIFRYGYHDKYMMYMEGKSSGADLVAILAYAAFIPAVLLTLYAVVYTGVTLIRA